MRTLSPPQAISRAPACFFGLLPHSFASLPLCCRPMFGELSSAVGGKYLKDALFLHLADDQDKLEHVCPRQSRQVRLIARDPTLSVPPARPSIGWARFALRLGS